MDTETLNDRVLPIKAISIFLSIAIVLALCPSVAYAITESEVQEAKEEYQAAEDAASEAAETYYKALDAHDAAVEAMNVAEEKIEETTAELEVKQEQLSSRAVSMYKTGNYTLIDVILGCTSFSEFATTWDLLNKVNENDAELIAEVKELKSEQEAAYEEYSEQEEEAATQLAAADEALGETEAAAAELEEVYNSMSEELQEQVLAEAEAEAEAEAQAAAEAAEAATVAEETETESSSSDSSSSSSSTSSSTSSSSSSSSSGYVNNGGSSVCDVSLALAQVGKSYVYGATGPDAFDCSGLCYYCGAPYRSSAALYANATSRLPVSEAQAGDVLWKSGHVGISLGGEDFVHAANAATGVVIGHNASSYFTYVLRF